MYTGNINIVVGMLSSSISITYELRIDKDTGLKLKENRKKLNDFLLTLDDRLELVFHFWLLYIKIR